MAASLNTVSFDLFSVYEIRSILRRKYFLLPPVSFVAVLQLASHPYTRIGSI